MEESGWEEAGVEAAGGGYAEGSERKGVERKLPEFAVSGLGRILVTGMIGCERGVGVAVEWGSGREDAGIVPESCLLQRLEDPGVVGAEAEEGGAEADWMLADSVFD